ncbi:MAG: hypothetical protein RIC14_02915 [Filomicrobium sp.]
MTDAAKADPAASGSKPADAPQLEPIVYASGRLRKVAFSLIFLLLAPFFVSLGPMLFARIYHGQWLDTSGLIILAIAFALLMSLIIIELISSIRSRVVIGTKGVRIRLPQARGLRSLFSYQTFNIPYEEIEAVETRREVYGGSLAPVIMKGARVCLKDGSHVKLGYINERNADPAFPFVEIGERIATRANVPLIDVGNVRRSAFNKTFGIRAAISDREALSEAEIHAVNTRHSQVIVVVVGLLVLLVGLGVVSDRNSDIGHASLFSSSN